MKKIILTSIAWVVRISGLVIATLFWMGVLTFLGAIGYTIYTENTTTEIVEGGVFALVVVLCLIIGLLIIAAVFGLLEELWDWATNRVSKNKKRNEKNEEW